MKILARLLLFLALLSPIAAHAQSAGVVVSDCAAGVPTVYRIGSTAPFSLLNTGAACISGSISTSTSGFTATSTGTPFTATTGGATGTLPAGAVVVATNVSSSIAAYCALGASATTSSQYIPAGAWFAFTVGASTQLTCITGASTAVINMTGGTGLPSGTAGGGAAAANASVGATGGAVPGSATYVGINTAGNIVGWTGAVTQGGTWNIASITNTLPSFSSTQTFNLGTLNGAATDASLTGGSQKTQIVDSGGSVIGSTANALDVNIKSGGGAGGTSSNFAAAFPSAGTAVGMSQGGNMVALTGTSNNLNVQCANCSGSGASAVDEAAITFGTSVFAPMGGAYQTTATSNPLVSGQQGMAQLTINRAVHMNLRNAVGVQVGDATTPLQVSLANTAANATAVKVDGSAVTQPVSGTVAFSNSTIAVTQATAASLNATVVGTGTFATQATLAAETTKVIGTVNQGTSPWVTTAVPTASTTGGLTTFFLQPTASDNHANIKNGAGQVYHIVATNNSATVNYLRLYNAASGFNGCNSATNLVTQVAIPANTSAAGFVIPIDLGYVFSTGISICVTSGYATTDTTNATASAMSVTVGYK